MPQKNLCFYYLIIDILGTCFFCVFIKALKAFVFNSCGKDFSPVSSCELNTCASNNVDGIKVSFLSRRQSDGPTERQR